MIYDYKYGMMDGWCGDEDEIDYQSRLDAGYQNDEWYDEYEE